MNHRVTRTLRFGRKGQAFAITAIFTALFVNSLISSAPWFAAPANAWAAAAEAPKAKPVRAMNLALGNMVYLAKELGLSVKNAKQENVDGTKIAARIEAQLNSLRDTYRREIAADPNLLGSMTLQFAVSAKGEVSQVKEVSGRVSSVELKKAVLTDVAKWNFAELLKETVTVQCSLLFVQEGMDITTLARWEKSLGAVPEKVAAAKPAEAKETPRGAAPALATAAVAKPTTETKPTPPPPAKEAPKAAQFKADGGQEYQLKYATLLRKDPNFNAPVVTTFTIGTKVTVIKNDGDWLEVRATQTGPSGFIRKEFIAPKVSTEN